MKSILLSLALAATASAQVNCWLQSPIYGYNPVENAIFLSPPNPYCNGCIMEVYYNDWTAFDFVSYTGEPVVIRCGSFIPSGPCHVDWWVIDAYGVPILWASTPISFGGGQ